MATDDNTNKPEDAYEIIKANPSIESLELDGKEYDFRNNGMFRVEDRGLALALREKYENNGNPDITVTKVRYPRPGDRGHRYFFGSLPEMPWKRKAKDAISDD